MKRKRTQFRLSPDNYSYLNKLATERDTDLNKEVNRLILEARVGQRGVKVASTVAPKDRPI